MSERPPWNVTPTTPQNSLRVNTGRTPEDPDATTLPKEAVGTPSRNQFPYQQNARVDAQGMHVADNASKRSSADFSDAPLARASVPTTPTHVQQLQSPTETSPFSTHHSNHSGGSDTTIRPSLVPSNVNTKTLGRSNTISGSAHQPRQLADPFIESAEKKRANRTSLGPIVETSPIIQGAPAPQSGSTKKTDLSGKLGQSTWRSSWQPRPDTSDDKSEAGGVSVGGNTSGMSHHYHGSSMPDIHALSLHGNTTPFSPQDNGGFRPYDPTLSQNASTHGQSSGRSSQGNLQQNPSAHHSRAASQASNRIDQSDKEALAKREYDIRAKELVEQIKAGAAEPPTSDRESEFDIGRRLSNRTNDTWRPPAAGPKGRFGPAYQNREAHASNAQYAVPSSQTNGAPFIPHVQPEAPPYNTPGHIDPVVSQLEAQGIPPTEIIKAQIPFSEQASQCSPLGIHPSQYKDANTKAKTVGVVKVSDIPYATTRQEIIAFFGRNARFITMPSKTPYYAIHIIMERATAKSMDAYVEFESEEDAAIAASRYSQPYNLSSRSSNDRFSRRPRIGDRNVTVAISSQEELLQDLFPRAKCVQWNGHEPLIREPSSQWESGFKEFITGEELHSVVRYATHPQRSRFAGKHVQRTFENMISIINKFPWWHTDLYRLSERNAIFDAARDMITVLHSVIWENKPDTPPTLSLQLLEELLAVALSCPAFSERQRWDLLLASNGMVGQPRWVSPYLAASWPFETLRQNSNASELLCRWYAAAIKQETENTLAGNSIAGDETAKTKLAQHASDPFGVMAEYKAMNPEATTFQSAANHETMMLQHVLHEFCSDPNRRPPQVVNTAMQQLAPPQYAQTTNAAGSIQQYPSPSFAHIDFRSANSYDSMEAHHSTSNQSSLQPMMQLPQDMVPQPGLQSYPQQQWVQGQGAQQPFPHHLNPYQGGYATGHMQPPFSPSPSHRRGHSQDSSIVYSPYPGHAQLPNQAYGYYGQQQGGVSLPQ